MSLIKLCEKGDLKGVKAALKNGADVDEKDKDGYTGLMEAVMNNCNSVVALLLNTPNTDVNLKSDWGSCALHCAVNRQNTEGLEMLLNVPSIDVNSVDNDGQSAVYRAAAQNNIKGLQLLLCHPNIDVNIVDIKGMSALHWAGLQANIDGLMLLLSHPSLTALTLNLKYNNGDTPVMLAVRRNKLEHLALLAADPRVDLDITHKIKGLKKEKSLEEVARCFLFCFILRIVIINTAAFLNQTLQGQRGS